MQHCFRETQWFFLGLVYNLGSIKKLLDSHLKVLCGDENGSCSAFLPRHSVLNSELFSLVNVIFHVIFSCLKLLFFRGYLLPFSSNTYFWTLPSNSSTGWPKIKHMYTSFLASELQIKIMFCRSILLMNPSYFQSTSIITALPFN